MLLIKTRTLYVRLNNHSRRNGYLQVCEGNIINELMHLKRNNCLTSISTYVIVKNEVDIKAVEMEYK